MTIKPASFSVIYKSVCQGQYYLGRGATGAYIDTLAAVNGCGSIRTLYLKVMEKPVPFLGMDKEIREGDSLNLSPGSFATYLWQDGSSSQHFTAKHAGTCSVIVTNACGSARDDISISEKACSVFFPNVLHRIKMAKMIFSKSLMHII